MIFQTQFIAMTFAATITQTSPETAVSARVPADISKSVGEIVQGRGVVANAGPLTWRSAFHEPLPGAARGLGVPRLPFDF